MIEWWLGKRDNVMDISGTPTLKSLVKALKENGLNGHAKIIEDDSSASISVDCGASAAKDFKSKFQIN